MLVISSMSPVFFSSHFKASDLTLSPLWPIFELVVAWCEQFHSSTCGNSIFSVLYFRETLFFNVYFRHLNQELGGYISGFISRSSVLFHQCAHLFLCEYCAGFVTIAL